MPEQGIEHFPKRCHWALLEHLEDPSVDAPEEAGLSLEHDVIAVAARTQRLFGWGKEGGLWQDEAEAKSFFRDAIKSPSLVWPKPGDPGKFEQLSHSDISPGRLPFDEWKAQGPFNENLTESQLTAEYAEAKAKWEKWVVGHPLRRAWEVREKGGDARKHLLLLCEQALRDKLNPHSPKAILRQKLRKTLQASPGWFRTTGDDWWALDTDEAARWLRDSDFSGTEFASGIAPKQGTVRHSHFPELLPSRRQIRKLLYYDVFPVEQKQIYIDELLDLAQAVFRVPKWSGAASIDDSIGEDEQETRESVIGDIHAEQPGDFEWPEAKIRIAAELLLLLHKALITVKDPPPEAENRSKVVEVHLTPPAEHEIQGIMARLQCGDPTLLAFFCPGGRRTNTFLLKYFLRVTLWLYYPTTDGGVFDRARYQRERGMATSTFGDWNLKSEPAIKAALRQIWETHDTLVLKRALRFLALHFSSLKPESVLLGPSDNEDEIEFDPLPDETGEDPDPDEE